MSPSVLRYPVPDRQGLVQLRPRGHGAPVQDLRLPVCAARQAQVQGLIFRHGDRGLQHILLPGGERLIATDCLSVGGVIGLDRVGVAAGQGQIRPGAGQGQGGEHRQTQYQQYR